MTDVQVEDAPREERSRDTGTARTGIGGLASDVAFYGATRVVLKSLAFLLVPLYAHFLTPAEFGVLELVLAVIALVDVLIAAGMDGVFARFYFDRNDPAWRRRIITLYFLIESIYPAVIVGTLIAFSDSLSARIFGTALYGSYFVIALVDVYLTNLVDLPMSLTRFRHKRKTFAVYSLSRGSIQIVLSVLLVAVWHYGVKGILIASLVSVCAAFAFTAREWIFDLSRKVDWRTGGEMLSFAWPGILGGLAFYVLNLADRFIVKHYHGTADTGLYGVAFRYSQIVILATLAFRLGWAPWHYSWLDSGRHQQMVSRGAAYFFFAVGFLAVVVSAWILPVFQLLLPEQYWEASRAVTPLALAAFAVGANRVFAVGLNVQKRMRLLAPLTIAAAAIAMGLYFLLIPPFSYVGAAWATVAALACYALMVLGLSQRIYPVPWGWRRIGLAVSGSVGLCLASLAVDACLSITASIPVRVAITLAFPAGLYLLRFFPPDDVAALRARLAVHRRNRQARS
jgi:O-antigen/teichoic acid export membrane protein